MSVLILPMPPSANVYWRSIIVDRRIRVLLSKAGREYKERAGLLARMQNAKRLDGDVSIVGTVYFARRGSDLDNRIKPTHDALAGICYANDEQIAHFDYTRAYDASNPRVVLTIEPYEAAA